MKKDGQSDVVLIGAGIMSATLGAMLKELAPEWHITIFEKLSCTRQYNASVPTSMCQVIVASLPI